LALGAHRLGVEVDGLFAVGSDLFSRLADAAFSSSGLPSTMLRRFEAATGSGVGFTDAEGENCLAVHPGANALLSAADVRAVGEAVRRATLVLAQFEIADEPILAAFSLAREAGGRTLLNPSPFREVDPRILDRTSILVLNAVEAERMSGALGLDGFDHAEPSPPGGLARLAQAILARGPDTVVVTLGAEGAVAYRRHEAELHQPAFRVQTSDTMGAGDAFTAGLAAGLVAGLPLSESLEQAAACGAMVCRSPGIFDALPTKGELGLFLATRGDRTKIA
jgi:ribokinase